MLELNKMVAGRYQVLEKLNEGGMSYIYLAKDTKLFGKNVVLKLIKTNIKHMEHRFIEEVNILTKLTHPHIPQVYDYVYTDSNLPIIVMEYIEGQTLSHISARLSVNKKLQIILQIAYALNYLHHRSIPIIHQDIKPNNIMVNSFGQVKLIDFGISIKQVSANNKSNPAPNNLYGTPHYMAPELHNEKAASIKTDLYSFGVLLLYLWEIDHYFTVEHRTNIEFFVQQYGGRLPQPIKEMILDLLQFDVNHRLLTLEAIISRLEGYIQMNKFEPIYPSNKKSKTVIAVLNLDRGAGATTLSFSLAYQLSKHNKRVQLIEYPTDNANASRTFIASFPNKFENGIFSQVSHEHITFSYCVELSDTLQDKTIVQCFDLISEAIEDIVIVDFSSAKDRFERLAQLDCISHLFVIATPDMFIMNEKKLVNAIKYINASKTNRTLVMNKCSSKQKGLEISQYISFQQYMSIPLLIHEKYEREKKEGRWLHPTSHFIKKFINLFKISKL